MIAILFLCTTICSGIEDINNPSSSSIRDAFLLSCGAGFSTVIGAAAAFCLRKENLHKERCTFLAGCLSFAGSVMVYVSLIEIWPEALHQYSEVTESDQIAHVYTSLTFFGGIFFGLMFSKLVRWLETGYTRRKTLRDSKMAILQMQITDIGEEEEESNTDSEVYVISDVEAVNTPSGVDQRQLLRTGLVTAFSIALHNFPEGLVTFVAALADWKVGVATAFAIAMHNIPEGISIAIPFYYASESRWRAFLLAFISGAAEPVGALIGWAILGNIWGHEIFGLMFGLTAGIMVYISFRELFPLARKNDPDDKVTTICIFVGMFAMDVSLFVAA